MPLHGRKLSQFRNGLTRTVTSVLPLDGGCVLGMRRDEMDVEYVQLYSLLEKAGARPM